MVWLSRRAASAVLAAAYALPLARTPRLALAAPSIPLCPWESWTYGGSVDQAVQEVRRMLIQTPAAKIVSQSPDRHYMRVRFMSYDPQGMTSDDCLIYLVPTGDQGSAAVVQCRLSPLDADNQDLARSRRRIRDMRKQLGWSVRASGQGDAFKSFSLLESMFDKNPVGIQVRSITLPL